MNLLALLVFVGVLIVFAAAVIGLLLFCSAVAGTSSAWRLGLAIAVTGWLASGRL